MRTARDPEQGVVPEVKPPAPRPVVASVPEIGEGAHIEGMGPDSILGLQHLAGNAGVSALVGGQSLGMQRAPAAAQAQGPARPHIGPETEAVMHDQINQIVEMFQEMWLSASQEEKIVGFAEQYHQLDEAYQKETGYTGTDNLDRFLFFLKIRSYQHRTFSSLGIAQTYNTYDQMWRELKDSRLKRFEAIVQTSKKQATSGPEGAEAENFAADLGKKEGMGVWGILKGISMGLGKVVDTGTDVINWLPKKLGYDLKPLHYSEMIGDQFDEAGQEMFGQTWHKRKKPGEPEPQLTPEQKKKQEEEDRDNELFYGINPQQLGTAGGDVIFSLAMMSGGAGKMAGGLKTAIKAKGVFKGLEEIADKSQELFDIAGEVQQEEGEENRSFAARLLAKPDFQMKVWELAAAIVETIFAGAGEGDATAEVVEKFIVPALKGNITMTKAAKLIDVANNEKLGPEERKKATGEALIEFIKDGYLLLGGFAAKKDKHDAEEAAKAEEVRKRQAEMAASVAAQQAMPHMNVGNVALADGGPAPDLASGAGVPTKADVAASVTRQQNEPHMNLNNVELEEPPSIPVAGAPTRRGSGGGGGSGEPPGGGGGRGGPSMDEIIDAHIAALNRGGETGGLQAEPTRRLVDRDAEPMSSSGDPGTLANRNPAEFGVFGGQVDGVPGRVAVKIYPAAMGETFQRDLAGAEAAAASGFGPPVHGPVDAGPGRVAFAMGIQPGGFHEEVSTGGAADAREAAQWASHVNQQTVADVVAYRDSLLDKNHYYGGELQYFVDGNGRLRPIDFQGVTPLPPQGTPQYDQAMNSHRDSFDRAENDLRRLANANAARR